jgi:type I restriction enzyme R subunit
MGKHFSEDSRVKIPALMHLSRLGYQYLSTKEIRTQVHKSTNIFPPSLLKALNKHQKGNRKTATLRLSVTFFFPC